MNETNYTSLELSKKLYLNGFKLDASGIWNWHQGGGKWVLHDKEIEIYPYGYKFIPAYDILNDLCVKYVKELFGEYRENDYSPPVYQAVGADLVWMLQKGQKQEAEEYIRKHCLFNPKNKTKIK